MNTTKKVMYTIVAAMACSSIITSCINNADKNESEKKTGSANDTVIVVQTETVTLMKTAGKVDTVKMKRTIEKEVGSVSKKTTAKKSDTSGSTSRQGSLRLSYGSYSGTIKNGYPHGQGKLVYSKTRLINRYDTKERIAEEGDYVIGEFYNGFLVYGKHYDPFGDLIETLTFGVGQEDAYESK